MIVKVKVEEHEEFERDMENVVSEASIPFSIAALGGRVNFKTLNGESPVSIESGT